MHSRPISCRLSASNHQVPIYTDSEQNQEHTLTLPLSSDMQSAFSPTPNSYICLCRLDLAPSVRHADLNILVTCHRTYCIHFQFYQYPDPPQCIILPSVVNSASVYVFCALLRAMETVRYCSLSFAARVLGACSRKCVCGCDS